MVDDACIQPTTDVLFTPIAQAPLNVSVKNKWRKLDFIIAWPRRDGAAQDASIVWEREEHEGRAWELKPRP